MGGSIKVLMRTQGERFKVLQDDEGRSDEKPEPIVFPSSRVIAEKGYDMDVRGDTGEDDRRLPLIAVGLILCVFGTLLVYLMKTLQVQSGSNIHRCPCGLAGHVIK